MQASGSGSLPRDARIHEKDRPTDQRTQFQRDRDRILYTSAFRRLAGITQVVSPAERQIVHNRLTHTLEVAQIARRIAEKTLADISGSTLATLSELLDPDVVEAAALAHDLGHPPFGHVTERELDDLLTSAGFLDGFEGNAQSFRIVTKLAARNERFPGLNLTRATLNALLKYPWTRSAGGSQERKWGAYASEIDVFEWVRAGHPIGDRRPSLEASIMDWADDIAYAIHDIDDFYRAALIPLDRLVDDGRERERFLEHALPALAEIPGISAEVVPDLVDELLRSFLLREPFDGSSRQRAALRSFTAGLVARYIHTTTVEHRGADVALSVPDRAVTEVAILKRLTWYYVIDDPALASQQHGVRSIIRQLLMMYREAATSPRSRRIFPIDLQQHIEAASGDERTVTRIVADLIAGMTEEQVVTTYRRLTGADLGRVLPSYRAGP
jgi:dGTPase